LDGPASNKNSKKRTGADRRGREDPSSAPRVGQKRKRVKISGPEIRKNKEGSRVLIKAVRRENTKEKVAIGRMGIGQNTLPVMRMFRDLKGTTIEKKGRSCGEHSLSQGSWLCHARCYTSLSEAGGCGKATLQWAKVNRGMAECGVSHGNGSQGKVGRQTRNCAYNP